MKKRKVRAVLMWGGGGLVVLILLLQVVLFFFGDAILRESILVGFNEYAEQRFHRERMPKLDFDRLRLNLIGGTVSVTDLTYYNGLPLTDSLGSAHTYYRISIPAISVDGLHVWEVYKNRQIQLGNIDLEAPEIDIVQSTKVAEADTSTSEEQIREIINQQENRVYKSLSGQLDMLAFDKLEITNASFFLDKRDAIVNKVDTTLTRQSEWFAHHLTIVLNDFRLDSAARYENDRLFFTKDIQFKLGDYQFVLPDSSYTLVADTLSFSTQNRRLGFQGLKVNPVKAKGSANWYSLNVPMLEMTDVNLSEIFHKKIISIDSLSIRFPQVKGYKRTSASSTEKSKNSPPHLSQVHPDTLYSLVSKYWNKVAVNQFSLINGELQFFRIETDTLSWLDVPQYSLSFNDFQIDSTVNQEIVDSLSHVLPMDSINLRGQDIRVWFADHQHYFAVNQLSLNTDRQARFACNLLLDSARVQPRVDSLPLFLTDSERPKLGYDIRTSEVQIYGMDLEDLSETKFADVDSIRVIQPEVIIANFSDTPFSDLPQQSQPNVADTSGTTIKKIIYNWSHARLNLYPVIAPNRPDSWIEQMLVNRLNLDSGHVEILKANYEEGTFTEIAHVGELQGYYENVSIGNEAHPLIAINDTLVYSSQVAVFADEVDMALQRSWFQFPYNRNSAVSGGWLEAQEVSISTLTTQGYVQKVKFWPNRPASRFSPTQLEQMEIPYFMIDGINFGELYNLQIANLNQVSLIAPIINLKVGPSQREQKSAFSMPELFSQFEPYLDQLAINKLEIQQADITLQPADNPSPDVWFSTSTFNVEVTDFLLDSVTTVIPTRPFYSRELRVSMDDFIFSLPVEEEAEDFTAERFLYSSFSDQLTIDNLSRVPDSLDALEVIESFSVTQLALHRMNFFRYFTEKQMEVDKVIVRRPTVSIEAGVSSSEKSSQSGKPLQPELYSKIKSVTKGIYVNEFSLEQGQFSYLQTDPDTLHHFKSDSLIVRAYRLAIDSLSQSREAKMFFADEIDFNIPVDNYLLRLPSANQQIQAKGAILTNQEDRITVNELEIKPYGFSSTLLSDYPKQNLLSLSTPSLQIVGFDVESAFVRGELDVDQVNIMSPTIRFYQFAADSSSNENEKLEWSDISSTFLRSLQIDNINFTNGDVKIFQNQQDDQPSFGAEHIDISVVGMEIDSTAFTQFITEADTSSTQINNITRKLLLADDLLVRVKDYQIAVSDTVYTAKADLISLSTKNPQLEISGFSLEPRIPRYLYKDVFPLQKTRVAAQIESILLSNIDFEELIKARHLQAQSLQIDNMQIDAFKDARLPRNDERKLPMHQEMLLNLGFLLTLDTIEVTNGFINYAERVPDASQDGIITFEDFNALLLNATNHPEQLDDSVTFTMEVAAKVMGKGDLKVVFKIPMADEDMSFTVNGALSEMNLQEINPILENSAFVHIRDGKANSMRFYIQGNQERSSGELRFNYNDLNILLVDKNSGRSGIDERVGSLLANAFVVKSDNPRAVFFRVGEIEHERDPSRSIFSYWWRSLLSGIKSSIGMQPVAERIREDERGK